MTEDGGSRPANLVAATRLATLARLRVGTWLALLVPLLSFAVAAAWLYQKDFADARLGLDRAARVAQEHALKLFDTNEMLLQRMLDLVGTSSDEQVLADSAAMHERLRQMAVELPQVQGLFLHGADSRSLANSRVHPPPRNIDYRDRDWYAAHRSGAGSPVYVTELLKSRATGEPIFDMSRRRALPDGSYGGTVHVSLRPEYLTRFYEEMSKSEPGLRFSLLRADGRLIVRWPDGVPVGATVPAEHPLMRAIASGQPTGSFDDSISPFDGVARMVTFRRLDPYPLYVAASINRSAVVQGWQERVALLALFILPLTMVLVWITRLAYRRTRDELGALQRLDEETVRREQEAALRQRMEVALLQSQKLEALGRLTGGVAHDFNNLLMIVGSSLHLLRRLNPQEPDRAPLAAIERAVDSGTKLTRQLLSFAGRQALRPERIELQQHLPALRQLLVPLLGHRIEVGGTVEPDTAPVEVDPAELELALINLAVNAKDAMPDGGRLDVSARNASAAEAPAPGTS